MASAVLAGPTAAVQKMPQMALRSLVFEAAFQPKDINSWAKIKRGCGGRRLWQSLTTRAAVAAN